ncbi:MAG: ABC transporter substrate-binding protein [Promethearchaeota archaeon]
MEQLTKRILAIVVIAIIGTGIGVGAWFLLGAPAGQENPYTYPGYPGTGKPPLANTLKIGLLEHTAVYGQLTYIGMSMSAAEINAGGGIDVGGTTYYIGITMEDTKEAAYLYDEAIAATLRMIEKDPDIVIGGFRSEVCETYVPYLMQAGIPFMTTGCATTEFCSVNVKNDIWPYFFRIMPTSSRNLGLSFISWLEDFLFPNMTGQGIVLDGATIMYEELIWTIDLKNMLYDFLNDASVGNPMIQLGYANVTLKPITPSMGPLDFSAYWTDVFGPSGNQLMLPVISDPTLGNYFGMGYNITQPNAICAGINVAHQLSGYLSSIGGCQYEVSMSGAERVPNGPHSIEFWDAFLATTGGYAPVYTAIGAYDAIKIIANATHVAGSTALAPLVAGLETFNSTNWMFGLGRKLAFDENHDVVQSDPDAGLFRYSASLWCQYNRKGVKHVVPSGGMYDDALIPNDRFRWPHWWTLP